jgi:hypothetical protein
VWPDSLKLIYQIPDVGDDCGVVLWIGEFFEAHVKSPSEGFIIVGLFIMQTPAMFPRTMQKDQVSAS